VSTRALAGRIATIDPELVERDVHGQVFIVLGLESEPLHPRL
jgi:hypothetical protein